MATPKVTLGWYLFAKLWLENARVLGWDANYSRLGYAMAQSDPHRPQDGDLEYYMAMADRCKQLLDSPDYAFFDGYNDTAKLISRFAQPTIGFLNIWGALQLDGVSLWLKGVEQQVVWLEFDQRYVMAPKVKLPTPLPAVEPEDSE